MLTYADVLGLATAYVKDGAAIAAGGFFQGWTMVVASVACQVDVCWPMLAYADVCWRMLAYADVF